MITTAHTNSRQRLGLRQPALPKLPRAGVPSAALRVVLALVLVLALDLDASPFDNWHNREWSSGVAHVMYHDGLWVSSGYRLAWSTNGVVWHTTATLTNGIQDVIYAEGKFLGVGVQGAVVTSSDGKIWTHRAAPTPHALQGVAYGNGLFVAVGVNSSVVTSPDGINWTSRNLGTNAELNGVAFGQGGFVAVGSYGVVLRSTHGTNWSLQPAGVPTYTALRDVAYGAGRFVAVGDNGTLIHSPDGTSWTARPATSSGSFSAVAYGGNRFLVVPAYYFGQTLSSIDGIVWQNHSGIVQGTYDVAVGADSAVAISWSFIIQSDPYAVTAPVFVEEFADQALTEGYSGYLFAPVRASAPVTYEWFKDGVRIDEPGRNPLSISGVDFSVEGNYHVIARNHLGAATSRVATITVQPRPPEFVTQPSDYSVVKGTMLQLNSSVSGTAPIAVQWFKDGVAISGATNMGYLLLNTPPASAGNYHAVATTPYGVATSSVARVQVDTLKPIDRWTTRRPVPPNTPRDITYGNGIFVAVGHAGAILTSSDAYAWSERTLPTSRGIRAIEFANGRFLGIGERGLVVTSVNGVDWTMQEANLNVDFHDLTFGNGTFVALGWDYAGNSYPTVSVVATSSDGNAWTLREPPEGTDQYAFGSIAFGNGIFVAAGAGAVLVSADGATWEPRALGDPGTYVQSVAFGDGVFVALNYNCTGWVSADAVTWTSATAPCNAERLVSANGAIAAVRDCDDSDDDDDDHLPVPAPGNPYDLPVTALDPCVSGLAYGHGLYVAAGNSGFHVGTSLPGLQSIREGNPDPLSGITYGGGRFVAVGGYSYFDYYYPPGSLILASSDGINWVQRASPSTNSVASVCFGNGLYVAVGIFGEILTSPDSVSWTHRDSGSSAILRRVIFANNRFVAVGDEAVITSSDGISWTPISFPSLYLADVAYGNGTYIAMSPYRRFLSSSDGENWQAHEFPLGGAAYFRAITFGNGQFIVAGEGGLIARSADGLTWERASLPSGSGYPSFWAYLTTLIYADGLFLAAGYSGEIWASADGVNWFRRHSGGRESFFGVAYGNNSFVLVGAGGAIRQSDRLIPTAPIITRQPQSLGVSSNGMATFSFEVYGTGPFTYQWSKDGSPLPGETNALLVLPNVQSNDLGFYRVTVANALGQTSSDAAFLQFGPLPPRGGPPDPFALDKWHLRHTSDVQFILGIGYGNNTFVAVGAGGAILTSSNAFDWTRQFSGTTESIWNVAFANNTFVAVGENGIFTSTDAITWSNRFPTTSAFMMDAVYADGLWVVGGDTGTVRVSSDNGATWTSVVAGGSVRTVTFAQNRFVGGGFTGVIRVSTNGLDWAQVASPTTRTLWGSAYGAGRFVIVGEYGAIITSTNGLTWTAVTSLTTNFPVPHFMDLIYEAGIFVAVGWGSVGTVYTSPDGLEWTPCDTRLDLPFAHGIAFGQGTFLLSCITSTNVIYQSDPIRLTAPGFLRHLQDTTVRLGSPTNLHARVTGSSPFAFSWHRDGALVAVTAEPVLSIPNAQLKEEGFYTVVASNHVGFTSSGPIFLHVGVPPTIVQHPLSQAVVPGGTATFSVVAAGTPPFVYWWRDPDRVYTAFPSAEHQSFFGVSNIMAQQAGIYGVVVSNKFGYANSVPVWLTLLADTDGDGMPDSWESTYGFQTNNAADATLDFDLDGASNRDEYTAGTDPTDSGSVLRLEALRSADSFNLRFTASSNKTYTVQQRQSFGAGGWLRLRDLPAYSTNRVEALQQSLQNSGRFYRVVTPRQP